MSQAAIRTTLFVTFLVIFVATAVLTLLGIVGTIEIREGYLNALFTSLILEIVAAVIALFRSASFFGTEPRAEAGMIVGVWWELISNKPGVAVSFVQITHSARTGRFALEGETYADDGHRVADWRASVSWLDPESLQLVFLWSGNEAQVKHTELSGFCVMRFRADGQDKAMRGFGWFMAPGNPAASGDGRALIEMRRASDADRVTMLGDDLAARAQLVARVHAAR